MLDDPSVGAVVEDPRPVRMGGGLPGLLVEAHVEGPGHPVVARGEGGGGGPVEDGDAGQGAAVDPAERAGHEAALPKLDHILGPLLEAHLHHDVRHGQYSTEPSRPRLS